ncbi:hypothetical protein HNQ50_000228 [Silvimonas terrae]|uniref:Uncharacterized protein n=1 Tax=Silvimonas terrae TaxID=300266 RepID=A0A840RAG0_9NEIS|nr:ChbG/HpnK family deacetylase [Silvimonas terrae]MBB5189518.1 hypothetical protein [Silvimonas terrae]
MGVSLLSARYWMLGAGILAGLTLSLPARATPLGSCLGYKPQDKVVIVEATDVGMQPDIDAAAFELIDSGSIQTVALLPTGNNFSSAAQRAISLKMTVGITLALTNENQDKLPWRGVLPRTSVPSLYNSRGNLWRTPAELAQHATEIDVRLELAAQIAKARDSGVSISHLEPRSAFWRASPMLTRVYLELARQSGYAMITTLGDMPLDRQQALNRNGQRAGIITPDTASSLPAGSLTERGDEYAALLRRMPAGINVLFIRPALGTPAAKATLADLALRQADYAAWSDADLQKSALRDRIRFSGFGSLQLLQDKVNNDTDECLMQAFNQ